MKPEFLRLLDIREEKDKKIIRVALVSTIVDSYETVIVPTGCMSPLESVPIDYNHNRISTGARMKDGGFTTLEVPNGEGGTKEVEARVVEVEVYKDSRMWTKDNKDKRADEVPSLYENVVNGRIGWASVDFTPIRNAIEKVFNADGKLVKEVYNKWRLNFFSLLDTKPGQDTSYFLNVRQINLNVIKPIMFTKLKEQLTEKLSEDIRSSAEITDIRQIFSSDTEGSFEFKLNGELKRVAYTIEDEVLRMSDTVEDGEPEKENDENTEDKEKVEKENVEKEGEEEPKETVEDMLSKRCHVGAVVKNRSGDLAIVTKRVQETLADGTQKTTVTLKKLDNTELTIDGNQVGYSSMESDDDEKEWSYAEMGDVLMGLMQKMGSNMSNRSDETSKVAELEQRMISYEEKSAKIEESYKRIVLNAPNVQGKTKIDSTTDLNGAGGEDKEKPSFGEALDIAKARN